MNDSASIAAAGADGGKKIYTAGTLKYTTFGLVWVCAWLLWGDFIWTLLDQALPRIMPLKLKSLGASDTMITILNKTVSYVLVFIFAPIIGFRSDRLRTRWGRRIPFLLLSAPLVGLFLILIGSYEGLTGLLMGERSSLILFGHDLGLPALTLGVFAALLVGFNFVNIFANTIYYYLFNDVIPAQFISRFVAMFRICGLGASMVYNKALFPVVLDNFRIIFILAGIGYVVGFGLMCIFVKEGQYPPPPPNIDQKKGVLSAAKTFFSECFTHKFYWFLFLMYVFQFSASQAFANFDLLRNTKSLGLTMKEIGNVYFWMYGITAALMLPAGWIADRFHPVRVYVVAGCIMVLSSVAQCVFIFTDYGHAGNLMLFTVLTLAFVPFESLWSAAEMPMLMRVLPRDRFGQFCSANAMVRAFALMITSVMVGLFMDTLKTVFHMGDERYRYYQLWMVAFYVPMFICLILLYRGWKKHGGLKGYIPPGTDKVQA
jgi:Na+/melibiose symporter-like transporter